MSSVEFNSESGSPPLSDLRVNIANMTQALGAIDRRARAKEGYTLFTINLDHLVKLKKDRRFKYILIFKNHGQLAGATLDHSHGQLIALPIVPKHVLEELEGSRQYFIYKERCVFCDIIRQETESGVRVVAENDAFLTVAPYAPRFPFETWILPKRHESAFENSSSHVYESLAKALRNLLLRADQVLDNPAYNLIVHTAPVQEASMDYYHWHIEFMPRLTKIAGFEWGTGFYQNPTPPEEAAKYLREAKIEAAQPVTVSTVS